MRNRLVMAGLVLALAAITSVALAALPPGGTFIDDAGNLFEGEIEAIAAEGITKGCNPPANDRFCPNDNVTRGEMALFLVRAMGYTNNGGGNLFTDDDGAFYEDAADKLGTAKVTLGCNPPNNDRFCGSDKVTRGQMAAFLVRAMGYTNNGGGNLFTDDDGSIFENDIDKLATAGVTKGCGPALFCPNDFVTRGQMAAFLTRTLGLTPIVPPPPFGNRTVDESGDVGEYVSMIIGADGFPLLAYTDQTERVVRITHCRDQFCSATDSPRAIDGIGFFTALLRGTDDLPFLAYYSNMNTTNIAQCSDLACSGGIATQTIDPDGSTGTVATVGSDGYPLIVHDFWDGNTQATSVVHCLDLGCTQRSSVLLDWYYTPSVKVGSDGLPAIVGRRNLSNGRLEISFCSTIDCNGNVTRVVLDQPTNGVFGMDLVFGSDGNPVVSYVENGTNALKVAHCRDANCSTSPDIVTIDTGGDIQSNTSVVIASSGFPLIAYWKVAGGLEVARCADIACNGYTIEIVDIAATNRSGGGAYTAFASAEPTSYWLLAYHDDLTNNLKLAVIGP